MVTKMGWPSIYTSPGTSGLLALRARSRKSGRRFSDKDHASEKWLIMTQRSSEGLDPRRRRLLFRAWRRGVRETDLIVGRFADAYIDKFDDAALDDFERLIEVPNAALYAWVVGAEDAPAEYNTAVLRQLISFHAQSGGGQ